MKLSYRNATLALPDLCHEVLVYGVDVPSRNGVTKELSMLQVELTQPWPLEITSIDRNVSIAAQIAETMWVLGGRNDVEWLSAYLPQAPKFSDDGKTWRGGYGPRLRKWAAGTTETGLPYHVDQLRHVVDLLNGDRDTRRAVINIYDPAIDTEPGKDIPCNNWLHFLPRDGKLNLHVAIRSNDLMWGWSGINSFEWSALLVIVAGLTGFELGSVTFSISSLHLYDRHYAKAKRIAAGRGRSHEFPKHNPKFHPRGGKVSFDYLVSRWFEIEGQIRNPEVSAEDVAAAIGEFPEPMLRSWLQVLAGWWYNTTPGALVGTSLGHALAEGPKCKTPLGVVGPTEEAPKVDRELLDRFISESAQLHREKDAAYGSSWCKRGEQMAIMANIARKVDRLGKDGGGDTSLDTAQDLMIYAAKYWDWNHQGYPAELHGPEHTDAVHTYLKRLVINAPGSVEALEDIVRGTFESLEGQVKRDSPRTYLLSQLFQQSGNLAYQLWLAAQPAAESPAATEQEFLGNTDPAPVTDVDQWRGENATRFFGGYNI